MEIGCRNRHPNRCVRRIGLPSGSLRRSSTRERSQQTWPHISSLGRSSLPVDQTIRKVLIYRLGSLGDTVVALPCYHLLARTFPQAERVLLTNFPVNAKAPASAAVLGESGLVKGYMRYTVGTRKVGELLRLMWEIRRFRPDKS